MKSSYMMAQLYDTLAREKRDVHVYIPCHKETANIYIYRNGLVKIHWAWLNIHSCMVSLTAKHYMIQLHLFIASQLAMQLKYLSHHNLQIRWLDIIICQLYIYMHVIVCKIFITSYTAIQLHIETHDQQLQINEHVHAAINIQIQVQHIFKAIAYSYLACQLETQ